jgi:hypothetical protein
MGDAQQRRAWFVPYVYATRDYTLVLTPFGTLRLSLPLRVLAPAALAVALGVMLVLFVRKRRRRIASSAQVPVPGALTGHAHED